MKKIVMPVLGLAALAMGALPFVATTASAATLTVTLTDEGYGNYHLRFSDGSNVSLTDNGGGTYSGYWNDNGAPSVRLQLTDQGYGSYQLRNTQTGENTNLTLYS